MSEQDALANLLTMTGPLGTVGYIFYRRLREWMIAHKEEREHLRRLVDSLQADVVAVRASMATVELLLARLLPPPSHPPQLDRVSTAPIDIRGTP